MIGKQIKVTRAGILNGLEGQVQSLNKQKTKANIDFGGLGQWFLKTDEFELIKTTKKEK